MQGIRVRLVTLMVTFSVVIASGCAPQFIDVPAPPKSAQWVERDATLTHGAIGAGEQLEIVLSNVERDKRLSAEERVIWISGVDLTKSRLQRTHERLDASGSENNTLSIAKQSNLIETHTFHVQGNAITAKGQMSINRFKATEMGRYYVEFLNDGPMTEERVSQMMAAWKELVGRLKDRGLNTTNVILGGAKYDQPANAIVLVKVGK